MIGAAPLVVAHRGASGHRPEMSASAFRLAFALGADAVELDVVATRDGDLLCRHDLELSRTTDVAAHPEYAGRRRSVTVDGTTRSGWFAHDFTMAELRGLRCVERWPAKRPTSAAYDGRDPLLSLDDALAVVDGESARRGRPLQVYAELKHPAFLDSVGLDLADLTHGVRHPQVTWMSFDPVVLRRLRLRGRTRLVQLYDGRVRGRDVATASAYASGIGVRRKAVLPRESGRVGAPSDLVARAHRRDLDVLVWTHRAENEHLPRSLRLGADPRAHGLAQREAELLYAAGIDGLIGDFPEIAVAARAAVGARIPLAR